MHVPDGFLSARVVVTAAVVSGAGLALALHSVRLHLPPRRIPLLGLTAAFVFAAQMLNFPVAAGTSGHLLGTTLATVLLGPSGALVVLAAVLGVQCFLFADGGLLALGANLFNMGLVGVLGASAVFRLVRVVARGTRGLVGAAAFAAWCSIVLAAASCAGQLALSGLVPGRTVFPAMVGIHMLIGAGEAAITALVLAALAALRPELLAPSSPASRSTHRRDLLLLGGLVTASLAVFVAPFASSAPDGLEHVAERLGFASRATPPLVAAPLSDYTVPGMDFTLGSTALAGLAGTAAAALLAIVLARLLVPHGRARRPAGEI